MSGTAAMFVLVWRYTVRPERCKAFIGAYGRNGVWSRLFAKGAGYVRTDLLQDPEDATSFTTLDFWEDESAFSDFQKAHELLYREVDASCDELTEKEIFVGAFHSSGSPDADAHYGIAAEKEGSRRGK